MTDAVKFGLYFILGGLLVSGSTYVGAQGRGFLAAFISTFPAITGVTIVLIYLNAGNEPAVTYAKHLLWLVPAWLAYVGVLILAINRLGFWPAMALALTLYMAMVWLIRLAIRQ
jgi:hypothetical protein